MIEGWVIVSLLYLLGLGHHVLAMRFSRATSDAADRARRDQELLQRQLEMLREAIELSEYGARQEAADLISDAISLKA